MRKTAKHKLNGAYLNGALILAGIAGLLCESFTVFLVVLVGLLISSILSGEIR